MQTLIRFWSQLFPNPRFYGWAVVGLGFLCSALSSPGQSFAISLYLDYLIADLGISRVELSSLYAVATLGAAACLPVIGGWSDRVSGRRFLVLLGLAMLFLSRVQSVAALGAAFFALRLLATLSAFLGVLVLLLAAVGLYGTMAYTVAQRRGEIGVRIALGAARSRVTRLVLGEVGRLVTAGVLLGAVAAVATTRWISAFLFGLTPLDPLTWAVSALPLAAVALAAGAVPAWRAARMDPTTVLREG